MHPYLAHGNNFSRLQNIRHFPVFNIRSRSYPTRAMCEKIADFFDVDMDYLYGRTKIRKRGNSTDDEGIQITVTPKEKRFLECFARLNDIGQEKILVLMSDFIQLPTYTHKEETSSRLEKLG